MYVCLVTGTLKSVPLCASIILKMNKPCFSRFAFILILSEWWSTTRCSYINSDPVRPYTDTQMEPRRKMQSDWERCHSKRDSKLIVFTDGSRSLGGWNLRYCYGQLLCRTGAAICWTPTAVSATLNKDLRRFLQYVQANYGIKCVNPPWWFLPYIYLSIIHYLKVWDNCWSIYINDCTLRSGIFNIHDVSEDDCISASKVTVFSLYWHVHEIKIEWYSQIQRHWITWKQQQAFS